MKNLKFAIQLINNISIDNTIKICSYLNLDIQLVILNILYTNNIDQYDITSIGYKIDNIMLKLITCQNDVNYYCNGCFGLNCNYCNEISCQVLHLSYGSLPP